MVLLLRLTGPMQSWGIQSRFAWREAGREPSFSGVLGLLCAALGVPREEEHTLARLATWTMGVRVDREGTVLTDYQTAGGGKVNGLPYGVANARDGRAGTVTSARDYLVDADFLVGLEGEDWPLLEAAAAALEAPYWPLCLGKRSFPLAVPPSLGLHPEGLREVLEGWPWRPRRPGETLPPEGLRLVFTTTEPAAELRWDCPVCFAAARRQYRPRRVATEFLPRDRVVVGET